MHTCMTDVVLRQSVIIVMIRQRSKSVVKGNNLTFSDKILTLEPLDIKITRISSES